MQAGRRWGRPLGMWDDPWNVAQCTLGASAAPSTLPELSPSPSPSPSPTPLTSHLSPYLSLTPIRTKVGIFFGADHPPPSRGVEV